MIKRKLSIFIFIIFIIITISIIGIRLINDKISPLVMDYSIGQMKRIISIVINRSINSDLLNKEDMDNLFIINKNNNVMTISLDSIIVNKLTDLISDTCEDNLRLVEEGKYAILKSKFNIGEEYFFVPSGIIFKNTLFSSIGPKIPINLKFVGNVTSNIKTDVKEYGINNSLITISVEIKVEMMVILPFSSNYINITNQVPLTIKMITGEVPKVYGGLYNKKELINSS